MLQEEPAETTENRAKIIAQILSPRRVKLFVVLLVSSIAIFFAAMAIPIDASQEQSLLSEGKSLLQSATGGSSVDTFVVIFVNNVRVALIEMIPVLGFLFWGVSLYTTGQVLQAFSLSVKIPPLATGIITFAFPHALVEFAGYSFALSEGTILLWAALKRRFRAELRLAGYQVFLVAATLLLAALIETVEIVSPGVGLVMWIPVILIITGAALRVRTGTPR